MERHFCDADVTSRVSAKIARGFGATFGEARSDEGTSTSRSGNALTSWNQLQVGNVTWNGGYRRATAATQYCP